MLGSELLLVGWSVFVVVAAVARKL
jgi:hypothetical protein